MYFGNDIHGLGLGQILCSDNCCDCGTCFIVRSKGCTILWTRCQIFSSFFFFCVAFYQFFPQCVVDPLSPPRHEVLASAGHMNEPVWELERCTRDGACAFSVDSVCSVPTASDTEAAFREEMREKQARGATNIRRPALRVSRR